MSGHYADSRRLRLRGFAHCVSKFMLAIRLYIFALASLFLFLVIAQRGLGILEAIVITCAILFLIFDVRNDFQVIKREFQLLKELEERISVLLRP
jgi:hypothetical membrane protein